LKRHFVFLAGEQTSGKTYQLKSAINYYKQMSHVHSVFVCDRLGEFERYGICFHSYGEYLEYVAEKPVPRCCVFRLGESGDDYANVFREAVEQGDCVVVLDEGYEFAPSGSTWRGDLNLRRIVLSGRHLRNVQGEMCKAHLLVAAQYPKTCSLTLWSQAHTIVCGKIAGENARHWVRDNFGMKQLDKVDKLDKWEWQTLRGNCPKWLTPPKI
jgi:hypothetical protein